MTAELPAHRKILVVDDHEPIRRLLSLVLRNPEIELFTAANGDEAIRLTRREHPDLVMLDVCMPGMDGLEVCEQIRADPDLADVRVILMSAILGENGLAETCAELHADGCFPKPFNPARVRQGVHALLGMRGGLSH